MLIKMRVAQMGATQPSAFFFGCYKRALEIIVGAYRGLRVHKSGLWVHLHPQRDTKLHPWPPSISQVSRQHRLY